MPCNRITAAGLKHNGCPVLKKKSTYFVLYAKNV